MISRRIRQLRQLNELTLDQLSERSGVDRGTIHRIELGQVSPRVDTLQRLCKAMGQDLADLFAEHREAEARLGQQEAQRLLLRTLTARFGNQLMALQGALDAAPGDGLVRRDLLQPHLDRARWMLAQLRDASGNPPLATAPLDLAAFLPRIRPSLEGRLAPGQTLVLAPWADPLVIEADSAHLERLLLNLVALASGSLGSRAGVLELSLGRTILSGPELDGFHPQALPGPGPCATLVLEHRGPMALASGPATSPDLAHPLEGDGTDYAFPALHRLVVDHQGALDRVVEADGFRFHVHLPLSNHPAPSAGTPRQAPPPSTILLVDDEAYVRMATVMLLEQLGCAVLEAENGEEALERYRVHRDEIDLVFLDLHMPVMDGRETFQRLREMDPSVRIAFCTGSPAPHLGLDAPGDNLVGILPKPFRKHALEAFLAQALRD